MTSRDMILKRKAVRLNTEVLEQLMKRGHRAYVHTDRFLDEWVVTIKMKDIYPNRVPPHVHISDQDLYHELEYESLAKNLVDQYENIKSNHNDE